MTRPKVMDTIQMQYKMMLMTGIWPKVNPDIFYRLRTLTSWTLSIGVALCMMVEAVNDITDFTKLSKIIYMMISWIVYIIKLAAFAYNKPTFLCLMDFLNNPIFMSFPEDLDRYTLRSIKISNILATATSFVCLCSMLLYLVHPILDRVPLPFPFPYDLGRYRYLMYVFQLIGEGCAALNHTCFDSLCICLIAMTTDQLNILAEKLVLPKKSTDENPMQMNLNACRQLKQCVEHHLAIIKIIDFFESIFTFGLLCQFLGSIVGFCNTLFQFAWVPISWEFLMLSIYISIIGLQLFIYCWYGNDLITKSIQVGDACYMSEWHKCDKQVAQYLFIIMERSKRPLQITTMKFSVLSLASFMAILQWSYSLVTLLLNMYQKKISK